MVTDLSSKVVCFVDNGLFVSFARSVAPAFAKAYYYSPWQGAFPKNNQTRLGEGFSELERVRYPLLIANEIDLWIVTDIFFADFQLFLEERGARVWGPRLGEELETERRDFYDYCKRNSITVPKTEFITGVENLRKYLTGKKRLWVKLVHGYERGNMESWIWKDEHISSTRLDQVVYDLGAFGPTTDFAVQDEVKDPVELAEDMYCVDDQFPQTVMHGLEIKGLGLIGKVKPYSDLPKPLRDVNAKLAPIMKKDRFRGMFSLEGLYTKDHKYYVTDPCCRLGSPSNELLQVIFKNWAEIFWEGAEGRLVEPIPTAKYGFIVMVSNEQSDKIWQPLEYPKEIDKWVTLRFPYALNGQRFAVPQGALTNLAGVVGIGDTLLAAETACADHVHQVDGHLLEIALDAMNKSLNAIAQLEDYGIKFTEDPLPTVDEMEELSK